MRKGFFYPLPFFGKLIKSLFTFALITQQNWLAAYGEIYFHAWLPCHLRIRIKFCDFETFWSGRPDMNIYVCLNWILRKNLECELWYYCYQHPFSSLPFVLLCLKIYHLTTVRHFFLQYPRLEMQLKSISCLAGAKALGQVCLSPEARFASHKNARKRTTCSIFTSIFSTLILLCLQNVRIWPEFLTRVEKSQVNFCSSKGQYLPCLQS